MMQSRPAIEFLGDHGFFKCAIIIMGFHGLSLFVMVLEKSFRTGSRLGSLFFHPFQPVRS